MARYLRGFLILVLVALVTQAAAQTVEADLEQLALRLLSSGDDPNEVGLSLLPGLLPSGLPLELPLPEEATVIGSLLRHNTEGRILEARVVLDSALSTRDIIAFYEEALLAEGWTGRETTPPQGFVPRQADRSARFCASERGPFLQVDTSFARGQPTDVELTLTLANAQRDCAAVAATLIRPLLTLAPLPLLNAPAGSDITAHGVSQFADQASSSALLVTDQSLNELLSHYEAQLEEDGWRRVDGAITKLGAQSRWTASGGSETDWTALFSIADPADPEGRYFVSLLVLATPVVVSQPL